jgi:hypothetical protein
MRTQQTDVIHKGNTPVLIALTFFLLILFSIYLWLSAYINRSYDVIYILNFVDF